MSDIILTTLNAQYAHSSLGLRCLMANLAGLRENASILEFDIHKQPSDIAGTLLEHHPRIIGIGVYIWNITAVRQLTQIIKSAHPETTIILGGPEVSFVSGNESVIQNSDCVITGEADLAFAQLCRNILEGRPPAEKIIHASPPEFSNLQSPYNLYTDEDIAHRVIYVEASRGCPFGCEFCISSLPDPVRYAPLQPFLNDLQTLLNRGARQLKFVDRTFNLNTEFNGAVLEFCLKNCNTGRWFHFEIVPDHIPEKLMDIIARFPPGTLQLETGVQSFNEEVCARINRKQDMLKTEENLRFLKKHTNAYIHADLIAGLPGETLESFAAGFNRLASLRPHEIQVGILKRLPGAPIARHDSEWNMTYNQNPPYEILSNKLIDSETMNTIHRFARYWNIISNSGNFIETTPLIWSRNENEPFNEFMTCSRWLYMKTGRAHGIALTDLAALLFEYLTGVLKLDTRTTAEIILRDYQRSGRTDVPPFLRPYTVGGRTTRKEKSFHDTPRRQKRHLDS